MIFRGKGFIIVLVLILCLSLGIIVFSQIQIATSKAAIPAKQADLVDIIEYRLSEPSDPHVNTAIIDAIEQTKPIQDFTGLNVFHAPEGFDVMSDSRYWSFEKLEDLYNELKLNKHGEEFELIDNVFVHAESDSQASGTHINTNQTIELALNLPAFPEMSRFQFMRTMGTIDLYNGDVDTSVQDFAHTLSHEYGHHFTDYYMFANGIVQDSDYERFRAITNHEIFYDNQDYDHYLANHAWYLKEIAAEDYVQLMGSPMTKNISRYVDIQQQLYGAKHPKYWNSLNGFPQENLDIALAHEVEGLEAYFKGFLGLEPSSENNPIIQFKPSITAGKSYHDSMDGPLEFTHYTIEWDAVYRNSTYTLIMLDETGQNAYPIKTVYSNQTTSAKIGTVSYATTESIWWQYDNFDQGKKRFFVTAVLPDGTLRKSDELRINFD